MLDNQNTPYFIQNSKWCYSGLAWAPLDSVLSQWIQSALFHLISLLSISVLSFHLHLVLTNGSFPSGHSSKMSYAFFISHVFGTCPTCLILVVVIITRFRTCPKPSAVLISLSYQNLFLSGRATQLSAMTLFLYFLSVTCLLLNSAHCCTECGGSSKLIHNIGFYLKNYVLPHLPNKYMYLNFHYHGNLKFHWFMHCMWGVILVFWIVGARFVEFCTVWGVQWQLKLHSSGI